MWIFDTPPIVIVMCAASRNELACTWFVWSNTHMDIRIIAIYFLCSFLGFHALQIATPPVCTDS